MSENERIARCEESTKSAHKRIDANGFFDTKITLEKTILKIEIAYINFSYILYAQQERNSYTAKLLEWDNSAISNTDITAKIYYI